MKLIKSLLIVLTVVSSISAFANSKKATTKGRTPSQAAEPDKGMPAAPRNQVILEGDSAKALFYSMAASYAMNETGDKLEMSSLGGFVTYFSKANSYTQFECKHKTPKTEKEIISAENAAYMCIIIDPYLSK